MMRRYLVVLLFGLSMAILAACEQEGPMEQAGEDVDQAVEQAGDSVEDATES